MKIGKREKVYLIVIPILFFILVTKSYMFDEMEITNEEELKVVTGVYLAIDDKYNGFLYESKILSFRVVSIKVIGEEEDVKLYKSKARKYLFTVIPYRDVIVEYQLNLE